MRKKNSSQLKKSPKSSLKTNTRRRASSKLMYPTRLKENEVIEELRLTVQKLKVFDSLGKTLTASLDMTDLTNIVIEKLGNLIHTKHIALALYDKRAEKYYFQYPQEEEERFYFDAGDGIIGSCLESAKGELLPESPKKDPRFDKHIDEKLIKNPQSMITLPIVTRGSVLGILALFTDEKQAKFKKDDFIMLETFSDYLAIAMENARNYQQVKELTLIDDVTGLYNSRYLQLILEREISRCDRYEEDLSLVFVDIDNFKDINDKNGHVYGSSLLNEFGKFFIQCLRTSDVSIRYGGDEFVLVLPRTNKEDALKTINRILLTLRSHRFLKSKNMSVKLTASFGIASYGDDGKTMGELIEAADKAMYHAKRGSKDAVYTASRPYTLIGTHR